jgi:hypothetical protein
MKALFVYFMGLLLFLSCTHPTTTSDELKLNFTKHLTKIDSSLNLDSFRLVNIDTMTEKGGTIWDDTIYNRERFRLQSQLSSAFKENKRDSSLFYQEEINYISGQIDSLTKTISKADTTKKFGFIITCFYQIHKNDISVKDSVQYVLDTQMNIRNYHFIDDKIIRSDKKIT